MRKHLSLSLKIVLAYAGFVCVYAYVLTGCHSQANYEKIIKQDTIVIIDSVLFKSQEHVKQAEIIQHKSDSIVHVKVQKKVKELRELNQRLVSLEHQPVLMAVSQPVEVRVDTVYIEIQKNFWGKKKVRMYTKVDSSFIEIPDSTQAVADSSDNQ
jgi:uncharacterized protein YcfL